METEGNTNIFEHSHRTNRKKQLKRYWEQAELLANEAVSQFDVRLCKGGIPMRRAWRPLADEAVSQLLQRGEYRKFLRKKISESVERCHKNSE